MSRDFFYERQLTMRGAFGFPANPSGSRLNLLSGGRDIGVDAGVFRVKGDGG